MCKGDACRYFGRHLEVKGLRWSYPGGTTFFNTPTSKLTFPLDCGVCMFLLWSVASGVS